MAILGLEWDVLDHTRELTQVENLFYVERLLVESNTGGEDVTPEIVFESGTVTFTAINRSTRGFDQVSVNRIGPVITVRLRNNSWEGLTIGVFSVDLQLRKVNLGVNIPTLGARVELPGRSADLSSNIIFDINPFTFPEDTRHISPVPRRLYIDIETDAAATVTPVLIEDDGTETSLTAITQATRDIVEFSILSGRRIKAVRLDGDFTDADTVLYDIALDLYIPGNRRLNVG